MSQFLIIKCSDDILESQIDFLTNFIKSLGNHVDIFDLNDYSLYDAINNDNYPFVYSYIYIIGHGNEDIFSDNKGIEHNWSELSKFISGSDNFDDDTTLVLKTCDGGNRKVAKTIFNNCSKIKYIYGVVGDQQNFDTFFNSVLFLYYIFWKEETPFKSTELTNKATNFSMVCFDRDDF